MPIRFRCTHCRQTLSVSRRKAGTEVSCPACGQAIHVPTLESIAQAQAAAEAPPPAPPPDLEEGIASRSALPMEREDMPTGVEAELSPSAVPTSPQAAQLWAWDSELGDWEEHPAFHRGSARTMTVKDEADMTSMVDVTFLMLVFFMITASFSVQKALTSQPPEPEEGSTAAASSPVTMDELAEESVIVEVSADDSILVDDEPVAGPVELIDVLRAKIGNEGKSEMLIQAEYRATHGMVVAVTDAGMQAGMQKVRRVSLAEEETP